MDPYIPSAHPFLSKNSGEMLKIRPGAHVTLERTRPTFEAPISVNRHTVRAPVKTENLPVLPLYSELELGAGRSSAPVPSPRKVPEPAQAQEAQAPLFKSMGGEDNESSTSDLPKLNPTPASDVGANLQPAPGFKSEGGDLHLLGHQNMEPFVPKFGFKSEGGGIYPLIPQTIPALLVEKPGFKSEGGDVFVQEPVVSEAPAHKVLAPELQETLEQLKSQETLEPVPQTTPEPIQVLEQPQSDVTLDSPGIPLVLSPLESLPTAEPIEVLAPVLVETLEQLKSRETPAPESLVDPEASLSEYYKKLIEEARTAPEELAPVNFVQPDTSDTQWSNLSTKPEEEALASAPVDSIQQPEVVHHEQEELPKVEPEEHKDPATVGIIYPISQDTILAEPQRVASLGQKSDYLQFEESPPQVPDASKELSQVPEISEGLGAPEASKEIQIKNMDLLYDQVSYYNTSQEPAEFEVPESVVVESVRSMILEPETPAPREDSLRNDFEEFNHDTVAQENASGYQLSENERQLIEENKKFFESGQDHVESPQEINPIMMWSQRMNESYSTPDSAPVAESAGSPEPPVEDNGNIGSPITELDSLVGEFEQFEDDELMEVKKNEQEVPPTM